MTTVSFEQIKEYLPFLIPLLVIQYGLAFYCLVKLLKQQSVHYLNKWIWAVLILFIQFIGPILYLMTEGKEQE